MADHQGWIVVELTDDGDPAEVRECMVDDRYPDRFRSQQQGGSLVFYDDRVTTKDPEQMLDSVSDHLDRVLIVQSIEGGGGRTRSSYYVVDGDRLGEPVDELSTHTRWFVESHFDYYASRYGIDGAV